MPPTPLLRLSTLRSLRRQSHHPLPIQIRTFTQSPLSPFPRKDSQNRTSINTEATEYSKSGTDDASARQQEAAFDPRKTSPEQEKDVAGQGHGKQGPEGNPLEVSPANPEVSKPRGEQEGGAERSAGGKNQSGEKRSGGSGSPNKGKEIR